LSATPEMFATPTQAVYSADRVHERCACLPVDSHYRTPVVIPWTSGRRGPSIGRRTGEVVMDSRRSLIAPLPHPCLIRDADCTVLNMLGPSHQPSVCLSVWLTGFIPSCLLTVSPLYVAYIHSPTVGWSSDSKWIHEPHCSQSTHKITAT